MDCILMGAKKKIAQVLLPWVSTAITAFPITNWSSRLLDQLITLSEAN